MYSVCCISSLNLSIRVDGGPIGPEASAGWASIEPRALPFGSGVLFFSLSKHQIQAKSSRAQGARRRTRVSQIHMKTTANVSDGLDKYHIVEREYDTIS